MVSNKTVSYLIATDANKSLCQIGENCDLVACIGLQWQAQFEAYIASKRRILKHVLIILDQSH